MHCTFVFLVLLYGPYELMRFIPISFPLFAQYGTKIGKLLKGGEPDVNAAAKLCLHDFQRGTHPLYNRIYVHS